MGKRGDSAVQQAPPARRRAPTLYAEPSHFVHNPCMTSSRMTTEKIIARIARALADGDPLQALASGLTPTDLQSLLLHVYRQRSRNKSPAELLSLYERTAMLRPSSADARRLADIERVATQCAPA